LTHNRAGAPVTPMPADASRSLTAVQPFTGGLISTRMPTAQWPFNSLSRGDQYQLGQCQTNGQSVTIHCTVTADVSVCLDRRLRAVRVRGCREKKLAVRKQSKNCHCL